MMDTTPSGLSFSPPPGGKGYTHDPQRQPGSPQADSRPGWQEQHPWQMCAPSTHSLPSSLSSAPTRGSSLTTRDSRSAQGLKNTFFLTSTPRMLSLHTPISQAAEISQSTKGGQGLGILGGKEAALGSGAPGSPSSPPLEEGAYRMSSGLCSDPFFFINPLPLHPRKKTLTSLPPPPIS